MVKGVLLDVDGTLVDSNNAHVEAWKKAFEEYGYYFSFKAIHSLIGMGGDQLLPRLHKDLHSKEGIGKEISTRREEIFLNEYVKNLRALKGVRLFVQKLLDLKIKVVVASSAKKEELEKLLEIAEVDTLITEYTSSDDVEHSKPEPDIITAALKKIHLSPEHVIMIGDTPYDIQAASKVMIKTIAVRTGGFDDVSLKKAIFIYDNLELLSNDIESIIINY